MGKHKAVDKSAAKVDIASTKGAIKGGNKKKLIQTEGKLEEENGVPKDGGAKPGKKVEKSEIDDIFSAAKKKASKEKRAAAEALPQEPDAPAGTAKRSRVEGSKDDIFGEATGKGRKRTEEGYAIYTEEELGLGKKGGDTDLCPFDCDCCF